MLLLLLIFVLVIVLVMLMLFALVAAADVDVVVRVGADVVDAGCVAVDACFVCFGIGIGTAICGVAICRCCC